MASEQLGYKIPQELQEVLLDFTVQYLVEQPEDLASFAVVYFSRLQARRPLQDGHNSDDYMDSEEGTYSKIGERAPCAGTEDECGSGGSTQPDSSFKIAFLLIRRSS